MRNILVALLMLLCSTTSALAGVNISIGLNVPVYPQLVPVPGYPVYYAPGLNSNYFFYDGMYWVFVDDNWYASTWYNGPWELVAPDFIPLFILRVPVRYYRHPPYYFRAWYANAPPRWGEHWGGTWEQHHRGWNNWNRAAVPAPAPLPVYQRQYSGARYPAVEQQHALRTQNYHYRPRDAVVRQQYQASSPVQNDPARVRQSAVAPTPPSQSREGHRRATMPPHQAAGPPPQAEAAQTERKQVRRPPATPAPAQHAATPPPRTQPPQAERTQRPAGMAPQAARSSPRGQPQHTERAEPQRTAAAPPQQSPSPRAHETPRQAGPQGNGQPPSRGPNQEREGGAHGGGGDR